MSNRLSFAVVVLAALAFVPGVAHILEMPNKLALDETGYVSAQSIYSGWALLGAVQIGSLAADLALAYGLRGDRRAALTAFGGALLMSMSLVVFLAWVFPANQETGNWTAVPPGQWERLRRQWEFGHAGAGILSFLAFCAVLAAALRAARRIPG